MTAEHDVVVDLVAMANPSLYVSNPVDVFKLNFSENLKIAEFCVKHKKRIVQFSTCEVYGITSARAFGKDSSKYPTPFAEDETPLIMGPVKNHRWIYACAKQLLERVLHAYGLEEGLNYSIIRPFNFIGPRIDYLPSEQTGNPRVFSHFMNALLYGTPIKLVDGGVNYRAYTYIDDAVDCISRIIDNRGGVCDRQIFNIGTPENEVTIKELANKMCAIFRQAFPSAGRSVSRDHLRIQRGILWQGIRRLRPPHPRCHEGAQARRLEIQARSRFGLVSHDEVLRGKAPREAADGRVKPLGAAESGARPISRETGRRRSRRRSRAAPAQARPDTAEVFAVSHAI